MATTERAELIKAVLTTRDELDPDFEAQLLEDIVDVEAASGGDGEEAMRAIDKAVTSAIDRGVSHLEEPNDAAGAGSGANTEDQG